ncbi:IPTL-CTERM sorting domain-containing protein [Diaphorobacter ruginosibacter]|uniref:IPTL-CTERM sorting domain-containing protein n=1 Tax=Diaphorobacter ruginosibacter TaxID=1715720 RepID=A0A7G9RRQ1_9BURK|nr:IPTL-CTERM sorting domain-containing protein [Diaphorobacter ruginosibacter]QNN58276.1 IPTL-CTERM sorting domain-containing protein [Diaphorobacter ruginosibacter]
MTHNRVARLNSDGSLDEGFNASMNSQVASLALQPDGKVVVGGLFTSVNGMPSARIARLNADGSLDTDFAPSVDKPVYVIALQPDGKLVLGGDFTLVNGQQRNHLARLNADGSLDLDFDPNVNGNSDGTVYSIALQTDGQLLVGGAFGSIGGQPRNNIARLTSSGAVDAALDPNANEPYNASVKVHSIALQADGKLVVGGDFTSFSGQPRQAMARVSPPEAALQQLVAAGNTGLRWLRSGSGPELSQVRFALSTTGADAPEAGWQDLGPGERIPGGWQLNGLDLPRDSTVWVRAQGVATGGQYGGSSGLVHSVRLHYLASSTPTPPDAPVAVQAVPGSGQVTLSWTAPANDGGSAITGYRVEVAGDPGKFCMAPAHGTSCVITGLTNGQNYTFNVVARNVVGNSVAASISGAPSATAPDAPGSVQALAGGGQVTVTWMPPVNDGGSAITGYRVEVAGDAGKFCTAPADGTNCTVTGLTNGLSYTFNVVARNVVGDSPVAIASATPTGSAMPPHPPRRAQTLAGDGQVTITWDAPSSDGGSAITGYRVEVVGDSSKFCIAVASQNQCTVTGLTNQQVYDFNVVARNIVGDSAPATAGPATPIGSILAPGGDLPAGVQGQTYLARLPLSGGLAQYRFAIVGGQLPAGLNAALSADGRSIEFSGTPTRVEVAHFTLHIADATFAGPLSAQRLKADPIAHDVTVEKRITITAAPINAAPTPVPTLGAWALMLLSLALAGFAAMGLGSMRRG